MSRRKDRERAQSGIIFRDGGLVNAEEWYKLHPTKQMQQQAQQRVNGAVAAELDKKFNQEDKPYYCTKCGHKHRPGTIIYRDHLRFSDNPPPTWNEVIQELGGVKEESNEKEPRS